MVIIISFLLGQLLNYFIALICASFHEGAHILTAKFLGIKLKSLKLLPAGLMAEFNDINNLTLSKKILIYLSGPFSNIVLAIVSITFEVWFSLFTNQIIDFFIIINFFLAILNLIPIMPLDGGRIVYSILYEKSKLLRTLNIYLFASKILLIMGVCISLLIFVFLGNYSFIIVNIFVIYFVYKNSELLKSQILVDMLNKKKVIKSNNILNTKLITAFKSTRIIDILKEFNFGTYNLVILIDKELNINSVLTEAQIINYALEKNIYGEVGGIE